MNGENIRKSLEFAGFNLFAVLDPSDVDDATIPSDCESLLLIGSAGADLWRKIPSTYFTGRNPVDEYSALVVETLMHQQLPEGGWKLLYPARSAGAPMPNLQNLGRQAGWHHDSPLGNGINPTYGLWFAYRAVVALPEPLAACLTPPSNSPCVSCADTPCITACPASALAVGSAPDLGACVKHRTAVDSVCAENCLARLSCPVAPRWRYADEQISYFYGRSLLSLRQWVADNSGLQNGG